MLKVLFLAPILLLAGYLLNQNMTKNVVVDADMNDLFGYMYGDEFMKNNISEITCRYNETPGKINISFSDKNNHTTYFVVPQSQETQGFNGESSVYFDKTTQKFIFKAYSKDVKNVNLIWEYYSANCFDIGFSHLYSNQEI